MTNTPAVPDSFHTLHLDTLFPRPVLQDISVLIPTLGRDILEESLYWIANGTCWPAELIIVDQGETSQAAAWAETLSLAGLQTRHIPSQSRGRAAGINCGLEQVKTTFVAITDDDCFVDAAWLETMAGHLRANSGAIITGRVDAAGEGVILVTAAQTPAVYRKPGIKVDPLSGGNMGTAMEVFDTIGVFEEDQRLKTAEDADLAYRALRAGFAIIYRPDAAVTHYGWRSELDRSLQYRSYARSHGGFYGKYIRQGDLLITRRAGLHQLRALWYWIRGSIGKNAELARLGKAYSLHLIPGILAALRGGWKA